MIIGAPPRVGRGSVGRVPMLPARGRTGHLRVARSPVRFAVAQAMRRRYHAVTRSAPAFMLINCVAYQNGRKLADIPIADISEYVQRPDCFVWVALFEPTAAEMEEMAQEFGLHPLAVEDASKGHQRPKIEEYGDSLFAVLHPVEKVRTTEGGPEELRVGEVDVFVGKNYVLSVRHRTQVGFAAVRSRAEREPELLKHGSGFVFYALIDNIVDRYFPILDVMETELENIEERIFERGSARKNIEALYELKRELMALRHAVAPLMEATGKLYGGRVPHVCSGMGEYFRDVYDHLHRIDETIEGIREMVATAIQVNLGMISLSENEVTKRLAAYGALITIPTLIAGIYGMNFDHMPELRSAFGYPAALATMLVIDGFLFWKFRRANWI